MSVLRSSGSGVPSVQHPGSWPVRDLPLADLYPQEAWIVERAVALRKREFATTRRCAREALATLGLLPCRFSRTGTGPRGGPRGCWAVSRTVPLSGRGRRPGRRFAAPGHRCRTRCPAPARSAGTHHVRLRAVPRTASDRPASAGAVGPGAVQQAVYEAGVRTPVTVWTSWTPNSTSTRTAPSSPHGCAFQRPPSGGPLAGGQRLAGHRHRRVRGRAVDRSVREAPFNRRASSRVTPRRT